jgi:hypothetical protein
MDFGEQGLLTVKRLELYFHKNSDDVLEKFSAPLEDIQYCPLHVDGEKVWRGYHSTLAENVDSINMNFGGSDHCERFVKRVIECRKRVRDCVEARIGERLEEAARIRVVRQEQAPLGLVLPDAEWEHSCRASKTCRFGCGMLNALFVGVVENAEDFVLDPCDVGESTRTLSATHMVNAKLLWITMNSHRQVLQESDGLGYRRVRAGVEG